MMATAGTIDEVERGAYRSRWRDGMLDLFGGIGVLAVGVAWWLELFWLPAALVPLLIVLWGPVRRAVVEPRIGRVTFGRARREREVGGLRGAVWLGIGVLALVLAVLWLGRGSRVGQGSGLEWGSAIPVGLLGVMALVAAVLTGLVRFIGYGLVLAVVGIVGVLLGLEPVPQILAGGLVITLVGGALVVRFLAEQPVRGEEAVE